MGKIQKKGQSLGILHRSTGYSSNLLMFFTGPFEKPDNDKETTYSIKLGQFTQTVICDSTKGIPYGLASRLIKIWIDTEIIYSSYGRGNIQKDYTIIQGEKLVTGFKLSIPESLTTFMTDCLGISKGSLNLEELQDQMVRMANVKLRTSFAYEDGRSEENNYNFINNSSFTWVNGELKESYFFIDPNYYKDIVEKKHWIMLDMSLVKKFVRNVEGIDLYRFIKHTCCTLTIKSYQIPLSELQSQLGDKSPSNDFKKKIQNIVKTINHDSLVNAEVMAARGRGKHSYLKLCSTKKLIPRDDDVINVADKSVEWLTLHLQKRQERIELIRKNPEKAAKGELSRLEAEVKKLEGKLNDIAY